jgi:hypothetical protein
MTPTRHNRDSGFSCVSLAFVFIRGVNYSAPPSAVNMLCVNHHLISETIAGSCSLLRERSQTVVLGNEIDELTGLIFLNELKYKSPLMHSVLR